MNEWRKALDQFLARHDELPRRLAFGLRSIVVRELAPCHEYIFTMRSKVVLLYSASERIIADGICMISVFRRHVTLTFVEGVELSDPAQCLRGSGKTMRHLRISTAEDLERQVIRAFLQQARRLAGLPRRRGTAQGRVFTRIKRPSESQSTTARMPRLPR